MNFVAHLVVATRAVEVEPTSDVALGAVLPDFAPMAGVRFDKELLPAEIVIGVGLHHRTDAAFHGHPWFVDRVKADVVALEAAGLPRGAARACAHVGAELLLDGVILEDPGPAAALGQLVGTLDVDRLGDEGVANEGAWVQLFDRIRQGMSTDAYATPELVAERLRFMLLRRPRLALPPECEPVLVEHLRMRRVDVIEIAPSLVDEVTEQVSDDSGSRL